jgi:DNA-directed RNA polymerase subunit alpha
MRACFGQDLVEQLCFAQLEGNELAAFDAPVQRSSQQFDPILLSGG